MNDVTTDPAHDASAKDLERLKNEVDVLKTRASAAALLAADSEGAPKGQIILGDKAGSLAPWLAHQVLADVARAIADEVAEAVPDGRVLVTDDANLLRGDLVSHQVHATLRRRSDGLLTLRGRSVTAAKDLEEAIEKYTEEEKSGGSGSAGGGQTTFPGHVGTGAPTASLLAPGDRAPTASEGVDATTDGEGEQDDTSTTTAAADVSTVGVALDLVRMTAVDYELTASPVTAEAGLLPRLTAALLAATDDPVAAAAARTAFEDAYEASRTATAAREEAAAAVEASAGNQRREAEKVAEAALELEARANSDAALAWERVATTAAAIVGRRVVLLDGFAGVDPHGKTLNAVTRLEEEIDDIASELLELRSTMSPVEAELTKRRAELAEARAKWSDAVAEEEPDDARIAVLKGHLDDVSRQVDRRAAALAPAQTFLDHANGRITSAESALLTIATPDSAGSSPLLRACSRQGLHVDRPEVADAKPITHVLYVGSTHLGADIVTRHSVLGSSGRLGFLGGTNASWVLLDAVAGAVVDGGAAKSARAMTYDLGSGRYAQGPPKPVEDSELASDPLARMEDAVRIAVITGAFALLVLSFVGVIALFV